MRVTNFAIIVVCASIFSNTLNAIELLTVSELKTKAARAYNNNNFQEAMPLLYAYIQSSTNLGNSVQQKYHAAYDYSKNEVDAYSETLSDNLSRCLRGEGILRFHKSHDNKPSLKIRINVPGRGNLIERQGATELKP